MTETNTRRQLVPGRSGREAGLPGAWLHGARAWHVHRGEAPIARTCLGDDGVAGKHEVVHVVDEAEGAHEDLASESRVGKALAQRVIAAADDDELAARAALGDGRNGLLELAHALAAAHEQARRQVGIQAELTLERRLARVLTREGRPDGQPVAHNLLFPQAHQPARRTGTVTSVARPIHAHAAGHQAVQEQCASWQPPCC